MAELIIKKEHHVNNIGGVVFERVEDDNPLYDKIFNSDYQKGNEELIQAIREIEREWFSFKNKYSEHPVSIEEQIIYTENIYKRVIELSNYTHELDKKYSFNDEYVFQSLMPLFSFQSEIETHRDNLYFQRNKLKELGIITEPTIDTPKTDHDGKQDRRPLKDKIQWKIKPEILEKHLEALKAAGYIIYSDLKDVISGKEIPRTKAKGSQLRNILYIFTIWREKGYIDESFYMTANNEGKTIGFQYEDFIEYSFLQENKKPLKNVKRETTRPKGIKYIEETGQFDYKVKQLHSKLSEILKI